MKKHPQHLRIEFLEARHMLAASPIITEFMASNNGTLLDGYGTSNDWIEIYNAGDEEVNLLGYRLTDNDENLAKWQFPDLALAPGQYAVVFASSRDEVDPAGHLHTNFSLSSDGEYLALVDPFGAILSEYDFPSQSSNVSMGIDFDSISTQVVNANTPAAYLIPTDNTIDGDWMQIGFDHSSWTMGSAGLGYEEEAGAYAEFIESELPNGTESIYVRIPFMVSDAEATIGTLRMKFDDGFVAYLNGVQIAECHAPNSLAFDSLATEMHTKEAAVIDKVFSISAYSHLLQQGENVLAIHVMDSFTSADQDLLMIPSLTVSQGVPIAPELAGEMFEPTPGAPNSRVVASEVQYSRSGGVFLTPFQLTLSTANPGEEIRYTLNGTEPTLSSPLYNAALSISASTQVKARIFGLDGRVGRVRTEGFTRVESGLTSFNSDLPIIVLENFGQGVPEREFTDAVLAVYEPDELTGRSSLADTPTLTSEVGQHRRGSSTYKNPKSNLRIEFRDTLGEDKDVDLLGMPAESDWILYAPYTQDHSMIRNAVMYDLSRETVGYAVRTRFVEVFSNTDGGALDANDYMGVYVLMETIKRDDNRIAIDELTPADNSGSEITGGYIIKVDRAEAEEDSTWDSPRVSQASWMVHVDPERAEMTQAQADYIRDYLSDFETVLWGPNARDPEIGYAAYIDVGSWIDHHMLKVFSRESDLLVLSEYLYKPRDGKLTFGPSWDFDRSSGAEGSYQKPVEGWNGNNWQPFNQGWWGRLFADPNFKQQWIDRWQELRETVYSDENLINLVYGHGSEIEEAVARNTARWPIMAPNGGPLAAPEHEGYEAELSNLANWLIGRAAWFDAQFVSPPLVLLGESNTPGHALVTLDSAGGQIYYTLDGSDPRESGGNIASGALLYTEPFEVPDGTTINARSYDVTFTVSPSTKWSSQESGAYEASNPYPLRIVELMYNPPGSADDTEYFEILNTGTQAVQLEGVRITEFSGSGFTFGAKLLAPGERIVAVKDQDAFAAAYPDVTNIAAGEFSGSLANEGELVALRDPLGNILQSFVYGDSNIAGWPELPDGEGHSLEYIGPLDGAENPNDGSPADPFDDPVNWRASLQSGGSPGTSGEPTNPQSPDFDDDGDVDGRDFLAWQRNPSSGNLADWQESYGEPAEISSFNATFLTTDNIVSDETDTFEQGLKVYSWVALPVTAQDESEDEFVVVQESSVEVLDDAFAGWSTASHSAVNDFGELVVRRDFEAALADASVEFEIESAL